MKLPNGERAIVEIRKLLDYCLNSQHPRGRNKARVFAAVGIREADAEELRTALLAAAGGTEAQLGVSNVYGRRYIVELTHSAKDASLESGVLGLCGPGTTCRASRVVIYYKQDGLS